MSGVWGTLVPLILGGAIVPIQIIITILLLRSGGGWSTAGSFVAGMASTRLVQGLAFGLLLSNGETGGSAESGSGPVTSGILVALGLLLFATALKQLVADEDPDAPPPKWITMTETMSAGRAFVLGVGLIAIGPKFWVLTLSAIGAIGDAQLTRTAAILVFVAFVVLTAGLHLAVLTAAAVAPERSASLLDSAADWLKAHNRWIVVVLGVVFGTWFLLKGLRGFGAL